MDNLLYTRKVIFLDLWWPVILVKQYMWTQCENPLLAWDEFALSFVCHILLSVLSLRLVCTTQSRSFHSPGECFPHIVWKKAPVLNWSEIWDKPQLVLPPQLQYNIMIHVMSEIKVKAPLYCVRLPVLTYRHINSTMRRDNMALVHWAHPHWIRCRQRLHMASGHYGLWPNE